jgi:hypothetical protein
MWPPPVAGPATAWPRPGFHHSLLADIRDRLAQDDRADRLLDLTLARLKGAGLVRKRSAPVPPTS